MAGPELMPVSLSPLPPIPETLWTETLLLAHFSLSPAPLSIILCVSFPLFLPPPWAALLFSVCLSLSLCLSPLLSPFLEKPWILEHFWLQLSRAHSQERKTVRGNGRSHLEGAPGRVESLNSAV